MSKQIFPDFETTGLNPYYNDIIELAIKQSGVKDIYKNYYAKYRCIKTTEEISNIVPFKVTRLQVLLIRFYKRRYFNKRCYTRFI